MHLSKLIASGLAGSFLFATASTALAGQNLIGAGFSQTPPGAVGPSISGVIYGNTSNPSGNGQGVLPSLSPGPWLCTNTDDCTAEPTTAVPSMGVLLAPVASDGAGLPGFANGKSPGPDFGAQ